MSQTRLAPVSRALVGIAALVLAGGSLTACASAVQQEASGGSGECVDGGTLTIANAQAPIPERVLAQGAANQWWARGVFEPLAYGTAEDPTALDLVLASDISLSDDDLTAVITLNEGVTFSTGRDMTADDVVWTFETAASETSPSDVKAILATWDIEKTGDLEVTITGQNPLTPVLASTLDLTPIVDSETYDGLLDGSQMIGTGPYVVSDYTAGAGITLERRDDYWGEEPSLATVQVDTIADSTAQISALRSGSTAIASGLTIQDATTLVDGDDSFSLSSGADAVFPLVIDTTKGAGADVKVRQAIAMAIDRDRINEQVFSGLGDTDGLYWSPSSPDYPTDQAGFTYDPDAASALVKEAGAEGETVTITYLNIPTLAAEYQIIANNLEAIGLTVKATPLAGPDFQARAAEQAAGNYLILRGSNGGTAFMLQTNADLRLAGAHRVFDTPEYEKLVNAVIAAGEDSAEATAALTEYMNEQAFLDVLVTAPFPSVVDSSVQGIAYSLGGTNYYDACVTQ
ncbi:ABC transporter substrate-binding protein [Nocardioides bruguierae]|uniref:ABC transporter substrate-binding protein n=1 Tax=Nocardioides bruguierae TaxID=2945102 RepID=A0A9X2IF10_9ACTN|nr:ABC transporter substrate-binding protein [Nocardioides bruguierae]MCL8026929.1 ABC transporter substrate-binding protein [Nocardioides bruguierae]MCM0621366.1 ABC transporter substrate-binding protein [Nocardioides bruguierae]